MYCAGNPVILVDPDGRSFNPIFDLDGNLLGTDDKGLKGNPIFMRKEDFTQGMSHEEAKSKDLGKENLNSSEAAIKVFQTMSSLPSRPDYDGHITLSEANKWYREGEGKPLYADFGKIDLKFLSSKDFADSKEKTVNLMGKSKDGNVYGHVRITYDGKSKITGSYDIYDFDQHKNPSTKTNTGVRMQENFNRMIRNMATFGGRVVANKSLFDYGTPYIIQFYGSGTIK
jgi:hypothetical protein